MEERLAEADTPEAMAKEHQVNLEKALIHVENMAIEHQARIDKVVDNTKILSKNLKEQDKRLNSTMETNEVLKKKHKIISEDNLAIVIPRDYIKGLVEAVVMSTNNQLMDSVKEAEDAIEELLSDDIKEGLKQVSRINDLKNRVCDLEDKGSIIDDLDYEIETAVQNELDYKDLVSPDDVHDIVVDRIDETDFVSGERFEEDIAELQSQIQSVERILGNEVIQLKNRSIFRRFGKYVISITERYLKWFEKCYNFKNKVRSKLFSIKK